MAQEGFIIVDGEKDPGGDLNVIGANFYAVFDGERMVEATADNVANLQDIAAFVLSEEDAVILEARLQIASDAANMAILRVSRTTTLPTGKSAAVRP